MFLVPKNEKRNNFWNFLPKRTKKNSLKNIVLPWESGFMAISKIPQGHRTAQTARCAAGMTNAETKHRILSSRCLIHVMSRLNCEIPMGTSFLQWRRRELPEVGIVGAITCHPRVYRVWKPSVAWPASVETKCGYRPRVTLTTSQCDSLQPDRFRVGCDYDEVLWQK